MKQRPQNSVFTIGHSNHSLDQLLTLLRDNEISAIADVRSSPFSRYQPHFNSKPFRDWLAQNTIGYVPLGQELGGRIEDPSCYIDGQIQYPLVAKTAPFNRGIDRLLEGMQKYRIAIMCSEGEPTDCHRFLLISRLLMDFGTQVGHIMVGGAVLSHDDVLDNLRKKLKINQFDLFSNDSSSVSDLIDRTYLEQSKRVAYINPAIIP
jgi:uncharacterized protein (DUF488 family)